MHTMKFTIQELKLAKEICFPDNFKELLEKHLPYTEKYMVGYYCGVFKRLGNDLITWIFHSSRAEDEQTIWGDVNEKIVADLLNKI